MKRFFWVLVTTALLIGATAVAVHFDDRELTVPPPDATGEAFMREVVTHRYSRAVDFVLERNADQDAIRRLAEAIERGLGPVDDVKAETLSRTHDAALVNVHLESAKATDTVPLNLIWSKGAWRIERVP